MRPPFIASFALGTLAILAGATVTLLAQEGRAPGGASARGTAPASDRADALRRVIDMRRELAALGDLQPIHQLHGHTDAVMKVAYSPDGKHLVSGSADHTLKIWNATTFELEKTLVGHANILYSLSFSPDGKMLVSGDNGLSGDPGKSNPSTIILWNLENGSIHSRYTQPCPVDRILFLKDQKHFVSACGRNLRLWEIGNKVDKPTQFPDEFFSALDLTPDGNVVAGTQQGHVYLWEPLTGKILKSHVHENNTSGVRVIDNDTTLISNQEGIWKWDMKADAISFLCKAPFAGAIYSIEQMKYLFISRYTGIALIEVATGQTRVISKSSYIRGLALDPAGSLIAVAYGGGHWQDTWKPIGATPVDIFDLNKLKRGLELTKQVNAVSPGPRGGSPRGGLPPPARGNAATAETKPWD
jgi:WD40 repeat protein